MDVLLPQVLIQRGSGARMHCALLLRRFVEASCRMQMNRVESPSRHPQRLAAAGALLLVSGLLAACEAPKTTVAAAPPVKAASTVPVTSQPNLPREGASVNENPDLGGAIKLGMSYAQLSSSLRGEGWVPVASRECRANVVGDNHGELCRAHPELAKCGACEKMPGLNSCSGSGDCLFLFTHQSDGKSLEVGMSGDIGSWNSQGPDAMFYVSGWRTR